MYKLIKQFFSLLTIKQRKNFFLLQFLVIFASAAEIVGVISIIPFMTLVGDIGVLQEEGLIGKIYQMSGYSSGTDFVFLMGVLVLIMLLISSLTSIFTVWRLSMFAAKIGTEIGNRLYRYYLNMDWLYHTTQNSAELTKKVVNETQRITNGILMPLMNLNAKIALAFFMIVTLFIFDPIVATLGIVIIGSAYIILYKIVRLRLLENGRNVSEIFSERYLLLSEGFGGIKDILLYGRNKNFTNRFDKAGNKLAKSLGTNQALSMMPRYFIELIAFAIMISLTLYLILNYKGDLGVVIPLLSVYAVAAIKILPAFQQIYLNIANIRANISAFEVIQKDLIDSMSFIVNEQTDDNKYLYPKKKITLNNVTFTYPSKDIPVLDEVYFSIPINNAIGIVGPSGSGKSTLIDILLGLILPDIGSLNIDDTPIDSKNVRKWQNCIGFVPQNIFLSEGSITENIAFGINSDEIDFERINEVIRLAHLDDLINSLADGPNTKVGERGIQLSGGQRQRIGIARALYQKSEVLIFDEATSSLDGISEKMIMKAIESFIGRKTIIVVAHRLKTVKGCDKIFFIDKGKVLDHGTYEELIKRNKSFREMAENA